MLIPTKLDCNLKWTHKKFTAYIFNVEQVTNTNNFICENNFKQAIF